MHDSGDFFSLEYFDAWKAVTDHFHPSRNDNPITFWAPTRIWAMGEKVVEHINRVNGQSDSNFIVRPSAYHINQRGPEKLGTGWAEPSVVYGHSEKHRAEGVTFDWDCKAYAAKDGPSCRGAENPRGQTGCRACWEFPDKRINYTLH